MTIQCSGQVSGGGTVIQTSPENQSGKEDRKLIRLLYHQILEMEHIVNVPRHESDELDRLKRKKEQND